MSLLDDITRTIAELKAANAVPVGIAVGFMTLAALRVELGKAQMVSDPVGPNVTMLHGLQVFVLDQDTGYAPLYGPNDAGKLMMEKYLGLGTD